MGAWKGYLIDLDGTLYHGNRMIEGADRLIRCLDDQGIPYLFVTNNSSRTPEEVMVHLRKMGIPAQIEHVCTSSLAAAQYIASQAPSGKVAVIGEEGLRHALQGAGLTLVENDPQYVVQGIDRTFTYEKLTQALRWIRNGAQYILTNPDLLLPTDGGLMPGAGTIAASIEAGSGIKPVIIGKPSSILMEYALHRIGLSANEVAVIGDNIRTDIAAGAAAGCGTILVLTGITTADNMHDHMQITQVKPDVIWDNLNQFIDAL
ncbi:TIGR01457 family HAD-type hydrolase [Paenibacillus sediminis]|uniref:Acid sugar phosphatase n=1 Tax=Paenibacillus sediminis TaxID=664909 RepID=A0ABS4H050_9BACL|nr:TIGR01457 family HAD-type hydrolase [Paenibacillus sediminis]MBP1935900.1 4-nitrophenyl phosphatase [Paenibacillus sediminis]